MKNIILIFILIPISIFSQSKTIKGTIKDYSNKLNISDVNIKVNEKGITSSDKNGFFSFIIKEDAFIEFSYLGYISKFFNIEYNDTSTVILDLFLEKGATEINEVEVYQKAYSKKNIKKYDIRHLSTIPSASGDVIKSILTSTAGVNSNNELSSAYSVRGGNYDENLVYINDIEVYRPFLVRSGQQEGLSIVNSDLVSSILFSTGGFEAKYGDKMSSVLDITYKRPNEFSGDINLSPLGNSLSFTGISKNKNIRYLLGARHKTNSYLLKSLDTKGEYKPSFYDVQSYITYSLSDRWEASFLGIYSSNIFSFIPVDRQTDFGTLSSAKRFTVYFDGKEKDIFETFLGAINLHYFNSYNNLDLKFISSFFNTQESETYDIQGQYWLDEISNDLGSDHFGESVKTEGVGTFLEHARNRLNASVYSFQHKGFKDFGKSFLHWGIKYQNEFIYDRINEWQMIDSSGFSIPHHKDSISYSIPSLQNDSLLELKESIYNETNLFSTVYSAYIQNSWDFTTDSNSNYNISLGIRANYRDLNNELIFSPRTMFSFEPNWKRNILFKLSIGAYHQPPFYREMRNLDGSVNLDLKAQKSEHIVLGCDYFLKIWDRPFKLMSELYYKWMHDLVPYEIENVRIRYYGGNIAKGYVKGFDLKLNGEFVPDLESWISLSIMETKEDIINDFYIEGRDTIKPGYIPRPTDQRVNVGLFFQDFLPKNPNYKMHLNLLFGSRLPFGPPDHNKYRDTLRMPPYRRVDIGFSALLKSEDKTPNNFTKRFKSIWLSLEVLNVLQIRNTISYLWITDIGGAHYAIPNYLTNRQINLKLQMKF